MILGIIKTVAESLIFINGRIGWIVLSAIDKNRMHHAEVACQQESEISELNVLNSINEVRNDAMKSGKWNEDHENTLNFLGNVLANEHDWEVEEVERYLYEVIATGPAFKEE
ncbi:MAG: hypothetical protein ACO24P_00220 [Candidatus Nanopelagicaceae bacterium]